MFAVQREEVINFIKRYGPSVPNEIRKKFGVDNFIMGAVLSELSERNLLKITNIKMGSSPFYYLEGQEEQLENLTQYLNPKDQETAQWLKKVKVAEDTTLDTLKRVSLRKLPDFAKQLKARMGDGTEILFWRYYLYSEEQAINYLKNGGEEPKTETPIEEVLPVKEEIHHEVQSKLVEEIPLVNLSEENLVEQTASDLNLKESISKQIQSSKESYPEPEFPKTKFYEKVILFFRENHIFVIKQDEVAKGEYEFLIKFPSAIGNIVLLVRAKDKKKLTEADVAPALLAAKMLDVSCLLLVTGEFTKKAQKDIQKLYTGLIIKKL